MTPQKEEPSMNQIFFDRVEAYTERAAQLFPGETTFTKKQLAAIAGKSTSAIYHNPRFNFRTGRATIKEFARAELS